MLSKDAFRICLGQFATGVTVITTEWNGQVHGMTANAFMSGSAQPRLIVAAVNRDARLLAMLARERRYAVSVLTREQEAQSRHFSGARDSSVAVCFRDLGGVPVLADALAWMVAHVVDVHPCGDHALVVGAVEELEVSSGEPLLFYGGRYAGLDHPPPSRRPAPLELAPPLEP